MKSVGGWVGLVAVVAVLGCSAESAVVGGNRDEVAGSESKADEGGEPTREGAPLGAVCVPSSELYSGVGGMDLNAKEIDDSRNVCASGICLLQSFRGRVSCPLGNADGRSCFVPGTNTLVTAPVKAQLVARPPSLGSTCSCRCDGPGPGPFCECGDEFECVYMFDDLEFEEDDRYAGSYCVPRAAVDGPAPKDDDPSCDQFPEQCEGDRPF